MKFSLRVFAVTALILFVFAAVFALAADDLKMDMGGKGVGESKPLFSGEDVNVQPPTSFETPGSALPKTPTLESKKGLAAEEGKPGEVVKKERGKISVMAEPGDGLVSVSWVVTGIEHKPGSPLRFAVSYGTEPGRPDKKLDAGTATYGKLRELRNYQPYYIKVLGVTLDEKTALSSEEVRVVPMPAEDHISPLEKSFAKTTVTLQDKIVNEQFKRELKQFGYDFFRNSQSFGIPTENLPVGADYIIGPGDSLRIDLWGAVQARLEIAVDRNGEITIPKVGNVKVWGLNYGQAKEVISKAISRYYKGYELNVTLGRLRTIQVFVVGEVTIPGTYPVSSLATVINALSVAGGPSKNGSLRTVRILRDGKVVQQIDLYDMFLTGDRSRDIRLENGDTVFVPVIGPVVAVAGEIKRPAIYELKEKTSLAQVVAMAGGITAAGDTGRIQVERIEGNSAKVVVDYEPKEGRLEDDLSKVEVRDRDMVKVFSVNAAVRQVITLQGNVARPGEYQYRKGMKVSDIIPTFDALLPDSFLDAAEVARLVLPDYHREVLTINLRKAVEGDPKENVTLHEQDTLRVFSRWDMQERPKVTITGEVVNPGGFDYYPKMTVRDLITAAGSLKRNALLDNAELTRISVVDGQAKSTRLFVDLAKALAGDPDQNLALQPDDVLIVRSVVNWLEATDRFVTLNGEVRFPGSYSIAKGERLSSVIARAGGFTEKAYLKGAKFTRKSVQESQQKRMNEVIVRTEKDVIQKQVELASLSASKEEMEATKAALDGLLKGLERLKSVKAEGRVVIRLADLDALRNSPYDLEMIGGDTLDIPQTPSVVNVMGVVYNPTTFVYMPGKNISYYLKKAGGPSRDAEEDEMYVIRADGSVFSKQQSTLGIRWDEDARSWTFGGFMSAAADPGDTLVVPQKLERIAWMRNIKDITTILSQIALTAGVILAAGF